MLCLLCCLSGVVVYGGDVTMSAKVGESIVLQSEYQKENVDSIEWKFENKMIAEYRASKSKIYKSQFQERLELNTSSFSLTVKQIKKEDSGKFLLTGIKKGAGQLDSKIFHLQVNGKLIILSLTLPP